MQRDVAEEDATMNPVANGDLDPPVPPGVLRLAEAYVFASPRPVTPAMLRPLLPDRLDPARVLAALQCHAAGRGVVLVEARGGWAFRTAPDLAGPLAATLAPARQLPRAAMEVLAAIALHQPVTRAEVEAVRGAALAQPTLDALLDAGLVQPNGRKEAPGRPVLWATTQHFLEAFGLRSLRDLPGFDVAMFDVASLGVPNRRDTGRHEAAPDAERAGPAASAGVPP
jgi:segregation and condensation protein B